MEQKAKKLYDHLNLLFFLSKYFPMGELSLSLGSP